MRPMLASILVLLFLSGCGGGGQDRIPVTGKITLDGQPVKEGSIAFVASSGDKTAGAGALVLNGSYALTNTNGLKPGKYRVEVRASVPTGKTIVDADTRQSVSETKEGVAAKFNENSTLSADVTASNKVFDFDVTSK